MCNCKDCKEVTLLSGTDGRGIVSITNNGDGTFTYLFTDGTIYVSPDLQGPTGAEGPQGPQGDPGTNGTALIEYITDLIGPDTSGTVPTYEPLTPFTYSVPMGTPTALYDITFTASIIMGFETGETIHKAYATIYKNFVSFDFAFVKGVTATTTSLQPVAFNLTTTGIISLDEGDRIDIYSSTSKPSGVYLSGGIFKVYKVQ